MSGARATQRLRRSWRLARWEYLGAAGSGRYDLGSPERPGHARGRVPVQWDGTGLPYRRIVTPIALGLLLVGAISGSFYASAGGLFGGDRGNAGTAPVSTVPPTPGPSTSSGPPVTVLPATPVPGNPTPTPYPGTSSSGIGTSPPCPSCPAPSGGPAEHPSRHNHRSGSPSPSESPAG